MMRKVYPGTKITEIPKYYRNFHKLEQYPAYLHQVSLFTLPFRSVSNMLMCLTASNALLLLFVGSDCFKHIRA